METLQVASRLYIFLFFFLYRVNAVEVCAFDQRCNCSQTKMGYLVDCQTQRLQRVPDGVPRETEKLYLSNNPIKDIHTDAFANLPNLINLKLRNTKLVTIRYENFASLYNLQSIDLQSGRIKYIDPRAFVENPNLQTVHLSRTPLVCTCELRALRNWAASKTPTVDLNNATCVKDVRQFLLIDDAAFSHCVDKGDDWSEWSEWSTCNEVPETSGADAPYPVDVYPAHDVTSTTNKPSEMDNTVPGVATLVKSRRRWCLIENSSARCPGANMESESCVTATCPKILEGMDGGAFIGWPETEVNTRTRVGCNNISRISAGFAYRFCRIKSLVTDYGRHRPIATWSTSDVTECYHSFTQENITNELEALVVNDVTIGNASTAADRLESLTRSARIYTARNIDTSLQVIDKIRGVDVQEVSETALVYSLSNLLDSPVDAVRLAQNLTSSATKFIDVLDDLLIKMEPSSRDVKYLAPNLALAAVNGSALVGQGVTFYLGPGARDELSEDRVVLDRTGGDPTGTMAGIHIPQSVMASTTTSVVQFAVYGKNLMFEAAAGRDTVTGINSRVIVATVGGQTLTNLSDHITLFFQHVNTSLGGAKCSFWAPEMNGNAGDWSQEGCHVVFTSDQTTRCECDHLTNFALLMDVYGTVQSAQRAGIHGEILSILSIVGLSISLLGVLVTMVMYVMFRKELLKDNPSKLLMNLCAALALTCILFLSAGRYSTDDVICKVIAAALHYVLVASFVWTAIGAFYMYRSLVVVFSRHFSRFLLKASIVGWGLPIVVVAITVGVNTDNYGLQKSICWLRPIPFYAGFVSVVASVVLANSVVFVLVAVQMRRTSQRQKKIQANPKETPTWANVRALASIFTILGLTWLFAFIYTGNEGSFIIEYLFVISATLQGFCIFMFYCVGRKEVRTKLRLLCSSYKTANDSSQNSKIKLANYSKNSVPTPAQLNNSGTQSTEAADVFVNGNPQST